MCAHRPTNTHTNITHCQFSPRILVCSSFGLRCLSPALCLFVCGMMCGCACVCVCVCLCLFEQGFAFACAGTLKHLCLPSRQRARDWEREIEIDKLWTHTGMPASAVKTNVPLPVFPHSLSPSLCLSLFLPVLPSLTHSLCGPYGLKL